MTISQLEALNAEFPDRENNGDVPFFAARLASAVAMRRADGKAVDRAAFLSSLTKGGRRTHVALDGITLLGRERAVVSCLVAVWERNERSTRSKHRTT